jgi:hypothetical protein
MEEKLMSSRFSVLATLLVTLAAPAVGRAAPSGVQWTPDGARILVNKDVGNERWAITLNLSDFSAVGNVFFTDGRAPSFIWCSKTGETFDGSGGELDLHYSCSGADRGLGGFAEDDWAVISNDVSLPLSFFIPEAETCDLRAALNGPDSANSGNFWSCGGSAGTFDFQIFANGTAFSQVSGAFIYDAINEACRIAKLDDGSYLDLEYSPSRDHLTIYEVPKDAKELIVSECTRTDF